MLNAKKDLTKIVFLDIETAPQYDQYGTMPNKLKKLFYQKYEKEVIEIAKDEYEAIKKAKEGDYDLCFHKAYNKVFKEKAHLTPEFGKIICISLGVITDLEKGTFTARSCSDADEKKILDWFLKTCKTIHNPRPTKEEDQFICCYNANNFDLPYLSKRIVINNLELPAMLDTELKPWEKGHIIDPKDAWKLGGYDTSSLEMLCTLFGVETAEDKYGDASGLIEKYAAADYTFVGDFCSHDVLALAQLYLKLKGLPNQLKKI